MILIASELSSMKTYLILGRKNAKKIILMVLILSIMLSTTVCVEGQDWGAGEKLASLYARINVILAEEGMDLGSSGANSIEYEGHYKWALGNGIKTLEDETNRKINIVAGDKDKFLDMYYKVSLELAKTGVFSGGAASLDPIDHYSWARDNVEYAKSTEGVRDSLIEKVNTAYESV